MFLRIYSQKKDKKKVIKNNKLYFTLQINLQLCVRINAQIRLRKYNKK
jgi:hypothetical protein